MSTVIPKGFKLLFHNSFAVKNLTSGFLNVHARVRRLEEEIIRLHGVIDYMRAGGSIAPGKKP